MSKPTRDPNCHTVNSSSARPVASAPWSSRRFHRPKSHMHSPRPQNETTKFWKALFLTQRQIACDGVNDPTRSKPIRVPIRESQCVDIADRRHRATDTAKHVREVCG